MDGWWDKENVVYTYNKILFKLKKGGKFWHMPQYGWNLMISCKRIHQFQKTNSVWFYFQTSKVAKLIETENRIVVARCQGMGENESCLMGTEFQPCKMKTCLRNLLYNNVNINILKYT